ncbi:MAG: hypothetical protein R3Y05_01200 [bacterium]
MNMKELKIFLKNENTTEADSLLKSIKFKSLTSIRAVYAYLINIKCYDNINLYNVFKYIDDNKK